MAHANRLAELALTVASNPDSHPIWPEYYSSLGLVNVVIGNENYLATQPQTGALALLFVIGAYAILYGILLVSFSLPLRGHSYSTNV